MRFRQHGINDYTAIAELRWLLRKSEPAAASPNVKSEFVARYTQHLKTVDAEKTTCHWLAEHNGKAVGLMTVRLVRKEPDIQPGAERWGYLTNSIVASEYRNQGIGTALLSEIIVWARCQDLELLIVWPSERSYEFYRRCGFEGRDDPLLLNL